MDCPKCQTENQATRKFCRECGAKLLLVCSLCGSENQPDDKFCGECGHNLKKPKDTHPIDYSVPQSYTPRFLADKILTNRSSIEGERKLVTVLFADVANYTAMAERLDPEEVHQIMDGCFQILMGEIHKYEGTINQFTGDGIMALFGAPLAHEDHAQRACHAALSIQKSLINYEKKIKKDFGAEFTMRIGLNSGPVIVGSIGDDLRMDYTAIGDTTNLASRIENLAGGGTSLVSVNTHKLAREFFEFKPLGKVAIKGKKKPIEVFELIKASQVETRLDASIAKGLTKFVGRKKSMAALREAYGKTKAGAGQVVGIVGDAGVGKSRLLLEFRNRLAGDEISYLEGRCLHFGGAMSFLPILDILKSYFKIKERDQELDIKAKMEDKILQLDKNLLDVLAPFHELLSLNVEDDAYQKLEPMQKREKSFEAIRALLVRESQNRPVVIVVEDLHWIDKSSEAFLDYLIGWLAGTRILLLLLYRPEYTHTWGSKSYYNRIGLDQLTTKSSAELIRAILKIGEPASELKELILNRAAGNPLYMEEFTHTLLEKGTIQLTEQYWALIKKASEIQVPDTIQGIIAARMDRLEDDLKRTMQVASVIGREFAFRILDTITGMKEKLKSHLINLQGLEFIYEKQLFPELEYIFKHALIQEVVYQSLLLNRRKELHERIGQAIEQLYADRMEENYEVLAHHYYLSRNVEAALHYLKLSGQKAMRNNSTWEAFSYYTKAISALDGLSGNARLKRKKLELIHLAINPIIALGFPENSLSIFEQGETLARELGEERSLIRFRSNIGYFYSSTGNYSKAVDYTEQAFEVAEKIGDIESIGQVVVDLYVVYLPTAKHAKIVDVMPRVIAALERAHKQAEFFGGLSNVYSTLFSFCAYSLASLGNFEEAIKFSEMGLHSAAKIDSAITLGICESVYGTVHLFKGDLDLAKTHLHKAIEQTEEAEFLLSLGQQLSWLGLAYSLAGEPDTGLEYADRGLKIHEEAGVEYLRTIHCYVLGICHSCAGNDARAEAFFKKGIMISKQKSESAFEGALLIWLGRVMGKKNPPGSPEAIESILSGIKISKTLSQRPDLARGYLFLGEIYAVRDQTEKAAMYLTKSMSMFKEMEMNYWLPEAKKMLAKLQN